MQRCEEKIRGERAVYSDLVFEVVVPFELLRVIDMLVHRLEPALDVFVLGLVEGLEAAGFGSGFVGGNIAEAVALSRGVRTDEVQLGSCFKTRSKLVRVIGVGCRWGVLDVGRGAGGVVSGMPRDWVIVVGGRGHGFVRSADGALRGARGG